MVSYCVLGPNGRVLLFFFFCVGSIPYVGRELGTAPFSVPEFLSVGCSRVPR